MISAFTAGIVAGYGVALPIGAVATYLIGLGARAGLTVAAAAALGVATTDGVYAALASLGGAGLRGPLNAASTPLTYLSAAVLIALAVHTLISALRRRAGSAIAAESDLSAGRAYLGLAAVTALNPATIVYFIALVVGGRAQLAGSSAATGIVFSVGVLAASASWQLLLAAGGTALGRVFAGRRGQLTLAVLSSAIMLALAVRLLLK